jgi:hypothetical protein
MRVSLEILRLILAYFDHHEVYVASDYRETWLAGFYAKNALRRKKWLADSHAKLTLRLVSRMKVFIPMPPLTKCYTALFDSEILGKTMFPHELPVKPSTCYRTPPRIREKYLLYRIKQHVELLELTDYTLLSDSKTGTWGRAVHNRSDKW